MQKYLDCWKFVDNSKMAEVSDQHPSEKKNLNIPSVLAPSLV